MVIEKIVDLDKKRITAFNSSDAYYKQLLNIKTESNIGIISLKAGGVLGSHAAPANQKMLVIDGTAVVSTDTEKGIEISRGSIVSWTKGTVHETRTHSGLLAIIIEY